MKTKLFLIAALLVIASMFTLIACNNEPADETVTPDTQQEENQNPEEAPEEDAPLNEYDVEGAKLSTEESRAELETAYKELQTLYNLAADTVAKTEGEVKEGVKAIGAEFVDLMANKISNPDYAKFEAFIKDAKKEIQRMRGELVSLVPSIV
ncbi:MAG: hypothetical protein IJO52_07025 [Clostridia bacterium]|nr:hypothetical protein [Clostridia bacterium]